MLEPSSAQKPSSSTIRLSVPLILACLAGLWSERSGIVDIGLEGKMLIAAFAAASAAAFTGNRLARRCCSPSRVARFLAGAWLCLDQPEAATRSSPVWPSTCWQRAWPWCSAMNGSRKAAERHASEPARFMPIDIPGISALYDVPVLGYAGQDRLRHSLLTYVAFALVPLSAWALSRTRFGLRLRAVGENPHAVDTAGISVARLRYQAVIIAGVLCGIAGTYHLHLALSQLRARHDGGPWLHGAGRVDLRQLARLARHVGLPAVRLSASHGHRCRA